MYKSFSEGDKVTLTPSMMEAVTLAAVKPQMYKQGIVTRIGSWDIVDVLWSETDHPISMKASELVIL